MRLIGMLDSPYVRRVAVSLDLLGIAFTHEAVSVFSTYDKFHAINPVVKAPSLICDDGEVIMDSSLILQFMELTRTNGQSLWSREPDVLQHEFRAVSLALVACEKSVQIIYERNLRPQSAQYEPWMERVEGQLLAAYAALEQEVQRHASLLFAGHGQAAISSAVAWQFTQSMLAGIVPASGYPGLVSLSQRMERTAAFLKYLPDGPGV